MQRALAHIWMHDLRLLCCPRLVSPVSLVVGTKGFRLVFTDSLQRAPEKQRLAALIKVRGLLIPLSRPPAQHAHHLTIDLLTLTTSSCLPCTAFSVPLSSVAKGTRLVLNWAAKDQSLASKDLRGSSVCFRCVCCPRCAHGDGQPSSVCLSVVAPAFDPAVSCVHECSLRATRQCVSHGVRCRCRRKRMFSLDVPFAAVAIAALAVGSNVSRRKVT